MKQILTHFRSEWYKYILELIVITAGVLGAFALNNWNEYRLEKKQEQIILVGLKTEFTQNMAELKSDHHYNTLCLAATRELLNKNGQSVPAHTVDSLFGHVLNYATFDPRVGVVEEIIASGKLNLIQDEVLRYRLTQWSGELNDLEEDLFIRREHYLAVLLPTYNSYVSSRNADHTQVRHDYPRELVIQPREFEQAKYDALLASSEFDGALYVWFMSQTWVHLNEENLDAFMKETLKLIEENIKE